jgi:hypothetical protein
MRLTLAKAKRLFLSSPLPVPKRRSTSDCSISRPIDPEVIKAVPSDVVAEADNDDGTCCAWAAVPGVRNDGTYASMRVGDIVAFYASRHYTYVARVRTKAELPEIADAIWGKDQKGRTWSHMFFLSRPTRVEVPLERLNDYLQDAPYQGFMRLSSARESKITSDYGGLEAFVDARLLMGDAVPNGYSSLGTTTQRTGRLGTFAFAIVALHPMLGSKLEPRRSLTVKRKPEYGL